MKDIALIDACVMYGAFSRDLLLTFMNEDLFTGLWTKRILGEYSHSLKKNKPRIKRRIKKSLIIMQSIFPNSLVSDYEHLEHTIDLPDPNDHHVLAAAIHAKAQFIITHNLKDFPSSTLNRYHITPLDPDQFLHRIVHRYPHSSVEAFNKMLERHKPFQRSREMILHKLQKDKFYQTVEALSALQDKQN